MDDINIVFDENGNPVEVDPETGEPLVDEN